MKILLNYEMLMKKSHKKQTVLIFGAGGFIGSNIVSYFKNDFEIITLKIDAELYILNKFVCDSDIIIHAAGVSRSEDELDFFKVNIEFSTRLYLLLAEHNNKKIVYFSSIHLYRDDLYGFSKRYNEYLFSKEEVVSKNKTFIIRTPGIFGPGAKPNNVSVVSTFCYNKANNIISTLSDPNKILELFYIEDLCKLVNTLFKLEIYRFQLIYPDAVCISVNELFNIIDNIGIETLPEDFPDYNSDFIKNILKTYNSFNNA